MGREREWARSTLHIPRFRTPVAEMVVARDKGVWLRMNQPDSILSTWYFLDAEGKPQGYVSLPRGFSALQGDRRTLWGLATDQLDVPYLVKYTLQ
jgi:hypothetical protein